MMKSVMDRGTEPDGSIETTSFCPPDRPLRVPSGAAAEAVGCSSSRSREGRPGLRRRFLRAWQATTRPLALALTLLSGAGTISAQGTLPEVPALDPQGDDDSCTAVAAGTTACETRLAKVELRTLGLQSTPTVSVSDVQQSEDKTWMMFVVSLSAASSDTVRVDVHTTGGTATSGVDYRAVSTTLTALPNSTEFERHGHVLVLVYDDQELEPDEAFTVTLTNARGATLGDSTATGTILNDDTGAALTASDVEDTTATLTISGHTANWWYRGRKSGTSQLGACTAVAAGTTTVSITGLAAATRYDYRAYSDSTCTTKLANVEFRTLAAESSTPTLSVSDVQRHEDGTWITFVVSLSAASRDTVRVDVHTTDGTATSGTDYRAVSKTLTALPNSTEFQSHGHVNVLVYDDQELEPDETFTVTLTNPRGATLGDSTATGTILNDDTGAALTASDVEDTTATLTISGHTANWWYRGRKSGTSQLGACTAVAAGTTTVSITGLAAATRYDYRAYSDSTCTTKLANVEFRTLAAESSTPTLSVSDVQRHEDGTWITFVVSLSAASRDTVRVDVHTTDETATSGTDYRAISQTLIALPNRTEFQSHGHVHVRVYDDQEFEPDETFTVTLTNPRGATLGDSTATGTILNDDEPEAPAVTDVHVSSDAGADSTYGLGDTISVTLTFDEAVDVAGTPRLKIDMDPAAWGEMWVSYDSGSGGDALTFAHVVVQPNLSTQGIAVLENSLELNGGTIQSAATEEDADLAHAGIGHDPNHRVDWRGGSTTKSQPETAAVTDVEVSSRPATGDTYALGETIRVTVTFNQAVDVTGAPRLKIDMDPADWGEKWAGYESGSGSALTFAHVVVQPNYSTQGIAVLKNSLQLNGGTIRSKATRAHAGLAHAGLGHDPNHKVDWRVGSTTESDPAAVTDVAVSSRPATGDTYGLGETIRVTVTFNQAVDVTGAPRLKIDMDPADWGEKWAGYESASGNALTFAHVVVQPNYSTQGIAVLMNSLQLNGGTIRSAATDEDADLAHAGIGHDPNHKVDWQQSSSSGDTAGGDVVEDPSLLDDEALAVAAGLTPDDATRALFGGATLSDSHRAALDRLGNRNGGFDLGDVLSWIERCRRGEARCGRSSSDAGPVGAAALLATAWGRRNPGRGGDRAPLPRGDAPVRRGHRRGRMARYAVGMLLAAAMTWSCADGSVGPVAPDAAEPDPGFLTVELAAPDGNRDRGVLLELEGPAIEAIQARGLELYESRESGQHQVIVAGSLEAGSLMQFRVPDRNQLPLYRVRVLQVTDEDYGLRDADEYRAVLTH